MSNFNFYPAKQPTFYYIGVTTTRSSIMRVFPRWAKCLGIEGIQIVGIDCKIHDNPSFYRKIVKFIKYDVNSLGALVTSHKIDLFDAARDLFDNLDPYAQLLGELSCISKSEGKLWAHAKDPITSGLAYDSFVPKDHWQQTKGEICILGAGGASLALTTHFMETMKSNQWPSKIHVTNRSISRLEKMEKIHDQINPGILIEYHYCPGPEDNDKVVNNLKASSLVINGTGAGKDFPGSPLTNDAEFPKNGFAWDYNFRGALIFLKQARMQEQEKSLHVEDGWVYFLHGWQRVIAEVFHLDIPISGPKFEELSRIALEVK